MSDWKLELWNLFPLFTPELVLRQEALTDRTIETAFSIMFINDKILEVSKLQGLQLSVNMTQWYNSESEDLRS